MFNFFTHLEKKAALEKYADSLNKIIHDHLEQNPNTSPRDILLHHARNCELENCGEDEPVTKRKRLSDGNKATTKRQKTTPLLERNQNLGNAEVKSVQAQNQKKAVKAREESSIKAMQQMQTSMAVSKNFLSSFLPLRRVRLKCRSERRVLKSQPLLLSLVCKHQRRDPTTSIKETPLLNAEVNARPGKGLKSQTL